MPLEMASLYANYHATGPHHGSQYTVHYRASESRRQGESWRPTTSKAFFFPVEEIQTGLTQLRYIIRIKVQLLQYYFHHTK